MSTSTDLLNDDFPTDMVHATEPVERIEVPAVPARHTAEADTFARHQDIPGHDQQRLADARILMVGAGGLNGLAGWVLARTGARNIKICDQDIVDRTNLPRQYFFAADLGQFKAFRLARNLAPNLIAGGELTAVALPFQEALARFDLPANILVVGVDNNACRLAAVREARARAIPAVFTMLSTDGMRCQCFLQGPIPADPCLWCALPNLDPDRAVPCASAIATSCALAAAFTVFFVHRALMGWPRDMEPFNWREADLLGPVPAPIGRVTKRTNCWVCSA